ncbi:hypothetical protein CI610_02976 [invertebrate metagenome]|uniref:Uncharacterized protein n=1 Tax=invertebrate metagenome TaxID=1711999 RepID=A0A2H9T4E4_9ZZZZ
MKGLSVPQKSLRFLTIVFCRFKIKNVYVSIFPQNMDPAHARALMLILSVRPPDVQEFLNVLAALLIIITQIPNTVNLGLRHRLFGTVQNV